jgi:hypothetical protein
MEVVMGQLDRTESRYWQRAAEQGSADAQYRLGLAHSIGEEQAPLDYVIAHKWLNLAARQGSEEARMLRAEVSEVMAREDIPTAQRLAREWIENH